MFCFDFKLTNNSNRARKPNLAQSVELILAFSLDSLNLTRKHIRLSNIENSLQQSSWAFRCLSPVYKRGFWFVLKLNGSCFDVVLKKTFYRLDLITLCNNCFVREYFILFPKWNSVSKCSTDNVGVCETK